MSAEPAPLQQQAGSFRPDIQGMRALAVLLVIVNHLAPSWLPAVENRGEGVLDRAGVAARRRRRKLAALEQLDSRTGLREERGGSTANDPAADDRDVGESGQSSPPAA